MIEDLKASVRRCVTCKNYLGRFSPDHPISDNNICDKCKSEYSIQNLREVQTKDGKKAVAFIMLVTVVVAGVQTKVNKIKIENQYQVKLKVNSFNN